MAAPETASANWEVTFFQIHSASGGATASLFANGRMQAPVDVFIRAVSKVDHRPHRLTEAELNSIQLVHYNNPDNLLQGDWLYSDQDNGYAQSLSSPGAAVASATRSNDSPSHKRLYVTTTRVAEVRIGARIRQPNGQMVSLHLGGTFDSFVHLTGMPPVAYNRSSITVTSEVVVANGRYSIQVGPPPTMTAHRSYNQVNYYVSTNIHPLLKAHIPGIPFRNLRHWHNCYFNVGPRNPAAANANSQWIWETGEQQVRDIAIFRSVFAQVGMQSDLRMIPIRVNQKKDALCLTRIATPTEGDSFTSTHTYPCAFELEDIYGNRGWFTARPSEDFDKIEIVNGRPTSLSTEQADETSPIEPRDSAPRTAKLGAKDFAVDGNGWW